MTSFKRQLLDEVVCPHCWNKFPPENALWIAESSELVGDAKLGDAARMRFLPTEFSAQGFPVDARGCECREFACPNCHLRVPYSSLETPSIYLSCAGAPGSGKTYYLTSSTWFMRRVARLFQYAYSDADPEMNRKVHEYEARQFLGDPERLVELEKTESQGELYDQVRFDGALVSYPRPFVFSLSPLTPTKRSEEDDDSRSDSRLVYMYDNAGESFLPNANADSSVAPVTRHLGQSDCIFFLYDPTQDSRFGDNFGKDPARDDSYLNRSPTRQDAVLLETIRRVRAERRMYATERYRGALVVVATKVDAWKNLIPNAHDLDSDPIETQKIGKRDYSFLRLDLIKSMSARVRSLFLERAPEVVLAAESFAGDVIYIPVSASGVAVSTCCRLYASAALTMVVPPA